MYKIVNTVNNFTVKPNMVLGIMRPSSILYYMYLLLKMHQALCVSYALLSALLNADTIYISNSLLKAVLIVHWLHVEC